MIDVSKKQLNQLQATFFILAIFLFTLNILVAIRTLRAVEKEEESNSYHG